MSRGSTSTRQGEHAGRYTVHLCSFPISNVMGKTVSLSALVCLMQPKGLMGSWRHSSHLCYILAFAVKPPSYLIGKLKQHATTDTLTTPIISQWDPLGATGVLWWICHSLNSIFLLQWRNRKMEFTTPVNQPTGSVVSNLCCSFALLKSQRSETNDLWTIL